MQRQANREQMPSEKRQADRQKNTEQRPLSPCTRFLFSLIRSVTIRILSTEVGLVGSSRYRPYGCCTVPPDSVVLPGKSSDHCDSSIQNKWCQRTVGK